MNKNISTALLVVFFVALFGVGFMIGGMGIGKPAEQSELVAQLTSAPVVSIVAFGKVTAINGRNIAIESNGQQLVIPMAEGAPVSALGTPAEQGGTPEQPVLLPRSGAMAFSDITIGSNVSITVKVSPDGSLSGASVLLVPNIGGAQPQ